MSVETQLTIEQEGILARLEDSIRSTVEGGEDLSVRDANLQALHTRLVTYIKRIEEERVNISDALQQIQRAEHQVQQNKLLSFLERATDETRVSVVINIISTSSKPETIKKSELSKIDVVDLDNSECTRLLSSHLVSYQSSEDQDTAFKSAARREIMECEPNTVHKFYLRSPDGRILVFIPNGLAPMICEVKVIED